MRAFALLIVGLASVAQSQQHFTGIPLQLEGSFKTTRRFTTYTITLKNIGTRPITDLIVTQIGLPGHEMTYRPKLAIRSISAKGQTKITYTLRGELITQPDPRDFGFTGEYRYGREKVSVVFPIRDHCRVKW